MADVEQRLANLRQLMANEYDQSTQRLFDFINQKVRQFGQQLMLLEGTTWQMQSTATQVCGIAQAMTEQMDKVEYQMESIRFGQKEEAEAAVGHGISELKTQILQEIDKEITALETKLMVKMNEDRQTTATRLQEIKDSVEAVQESQQRMWGTIERISSDLQELVQKDAGIEGEEDDTNQVLVTTNLNEEELAPSAIPTGHPM